MREVGGPDDVYSAVDELISGLNLLGKTELAAKLQHRVHAVAWTTRAELFAELRKILGGSGATGLPAQIGQQVRALIEVLDRHSDPTRA